MRKAFIILWLAAGCAGGQAPATEAPPPPIETANAEPASTTKTSPAEVAIPNAKTPLPGLLTGGQPSAEDLQQAAAAGYRTIISLRTAGEPGSEGEQASVEALGMRFVSIPIAGADDLTVDNARALSDALSAAEGPVMLHCGSGNRAGALLALKANLVDGQDADSALALGQRAGLTKLQPAVEQRLTR